MGQRYQFQIGNDTFEIESDHDLSPQELSAAASKFKEQQEGGVLTGVSREIRGQAAGIKNLVTQIPGAIKDVATNLLRPTGSQWALGPNGQRQPTDVAVPFATRAGAAQGIRDALSNPESAQAFDPTGFSSLLSNPDETFGTKLGRAGVLGAELLLPIKGKQIVNRAGEMFRSSAAASKAAASTAEAGRVAAATAEAAEKGRLRGVAKAAEAAANPKPAPVEKVKLTPQQSGVAAAEKAHAQAMRDLELRGFPGEQPVGPGTGSTHTAQFPAAEVTTPGRGPGQFTMPGQGTTSSPRDFVFYKSVRPGENIGAQGLETVAREQAAAGVTNNFEPGKRVHIQPEGGHAPTPPETMPPNATRMETSPHQVPEREAQEAARAEGVMTWAERLKADAANPKSTANAVAKAEAAAEARAAGRTEPPGRPPAYGGPERRAGARKANPTLDSAFQQLREASGAQDAVLAQQEAAKAEALRAKLAAEPKPLAEAVAAQTPPEAPAATPASPANRGGRLTPGPGALPETAATTAERWLTAFQNGARGADLPKLPEALQDLLLKRPDLPQPLRLALQGAASDAAIPQLEGVARKTVLIDRAAAAALGLDKPEVMPELTRTMQGGQVAVSGKANDLKQLLQMLGPEHGQGMAEQLAKPTPVNELVPRGAEPPSMTAATPPQPTVASAPVEAPGTVSKVPVIQLRPDQLKGELANVTAALDALGQRLMAAGRGGETLAQTAQKSDALSKEVKALFQRQLELRQRVNTVGAKTPGPSPAMQVPVSKAPPLPGTVADANKAVAQAEKAMRDAAQAVGANRAPSKKAALVEAYDRARASWANAKAHADKIAKTTAALSKDKAVQSLYKMVQTHGEVKAAARAKMSVEQLRAIMATGSTDEKVLANYLRGKLGADRLAKILDITPDEARKLAGGGKNVHRLPDKAAEGIYKAAEQEIKAGKLTPQTKALLVRLTSERGAADPKLLAILGVGGAGALYGAAKDKTDPLRGAIGGGLAGLGLGAALTNPRTAFNLAKDFRREVFLTGGAIPKNVMTAVGAPLTAAWEQGPRAGLRAAKEMFSPSAGMDFVNAVMAPPGSHNAAVAAKWGKNSVLSGRFLPSHWIGAIDQTATQALQRAGLSQSQIEHALLTGKRRLFGGMNLGPEAQSVADVAYPFQRVPANVFAEGLEHVASPFKAAKGGRAALPATLKAGVDLVGTGAAGQLISKWAGTDVRKRYIATILLAAFGPRTAVATLSAMLGPAGRQVFGGISPIPEQGLDVKTAVGWPYPGSKTPFTKMVERMKGQK